MSLKANLVRSGLTLAACAVAASTPAMARVVVGFGFGVPVVPAPWYYAPPPVVYAPPPAVYAPPPVAVAPAQPAYVNQAAQDWYYCDNPRGYYPYIASCNSGWHQVPAQPNQAPPH